ncbi:MAG: thymidylate synthase [Candidatus Woesearchaeota archaeon]
MKQYQDAIKYVLENGVDIDDRTGVGTRSVFGYQMRFDLQKGFPAVTTKKLAWKSVVGELLWFIEGSTDERRLVELTNGKSRDELVDKNTIWTANADNQGVELGYENNNTRKELGPIYGYQWRNFGGVDQITKLISEIKTNPYSRRLIVSAWNVPSLEKMALPPCHVMAHFRVYGDKLNCLMYQRSCDVGLGLNFNQASYSLLTHIIANECGLEVGDFVHSIGDLHIYNNHIDILSGIVDREVYPLPTLKIDNSFNLQKGLYDKFDFSDVNKFTLENYKHHEFTPMPMAV